MWSKPWTNGNRVEWFSDCDSGDGDENEELLLIGSKVKTNGPLIPPL
jgi:hypothetical protein